MSRHVVVSRFEKSSFHPVFFCIMLCQGSQRSLRIEGGHS